MSATVGTTIGVEEEFQLVDAQTLALADRPEVVHEAVGLLGACAQGEISTSQLEIGTNVVSTLAELRAELSARTGAAHARARPRALELGVFAAAHCVRTHSNTVERAVCSGW